MLARTASARRQAARRVIPRDISMGIMAMEAARRRHNIKVRRAAARRAQHPPRFCAQACLASTLRYSRPQCCLHVADTPPAPPYPAPPRPASLRACLVLWPTCWRCRRSCPRRSRWSAATRRSRCGAAPSGERLGANPIPLLPPIACGCVARASGWCRCLKKGHARSSTGSQHPKNTPTRRLSLCVQVVVDTTDTGMRLVQELNKSNGGRVTFMPLDALRVPEVRARPARAEARPRCGRSVPRPQGRPAGGTTRGWCAASNRLTPLRRAADYSGAVVPTSKPLLLPAPPPHHAPGGVPHRVGRRRGAHVPGAQVRRALQEGRHAGACARARACGVLSQGGACSCACVRVCCCRAGPVRVLVCVCVVAGRAWGLELALPGPPVAGPRSCPGER